MPTAAVTAGRAVRVMTGSPLPAGTETVIPVEDTDARDRPGRGPRPAGPPGKHLRSAGDDLHAGDLLLPAGTRIGPTQLAALLAAGLSANSRPTRRPRVAVLSTGDELVPSGCDTRTGPARRLQRPVARGRRTGRGRRRGVRGTRRATTRPRSSPRSTALPNGRPRRHQRRRQHGRLRRGEGGAAAPRRALRGRRDAAGQAAGLGPARRRPGLPRAARQPRLGAGVLRGVRPRGARAASGRCCAPRSPTPVTQSSPGRRQYLRGRLEGGGARVVSGPASHLLAGLARADCLVVVPEDVTSLPAGADVQVIPLS